MSIIAHCSDNEASPLTLERLPIVTYEAINSDINMILGISSTSGLRDPNIDDPCNNLALIGGVLINTAPEVRHHQRVARRRVEQAGLG